MAKSGIKIEQRKIKLSVDLESLVFKANDEPGSTGKFYEIEEEPGLEDMMAAFTKATDRECEVFDFDFMKVFHYCPSEYFLAYEDDRSKNDRDNWKEELVDLLDKEEF